jgi:hypothetical protein
MAKATAKFVIFKTVQMPARVKFKTKAGKTVSFKAVRTVEKKVVFHFRAD